VNFSDPTGHDVDCSMMDTACKAQVLKEKENDIRDNIENNGPVTWDNLSNDDKKTLTKRGWTPSSWNKSEYAGVPGGTDVGGTAEDPVVYISLLLGYGLHGPVFSTGNYLLTQGANACFRNPVCARTVFGIPTIYGPRLAGQTDPFHDFPRLLDPIIINAGDRIVKNTNYVEYQINGEISLAEGWKGQEIFEGIFQIGVELKNFIPVITHHFFKAN
jgi:hypothetical protein